jgi:ankyrin repeat protein
MIDQAESMPKQLAVARYHLAKLHLAAKRTDAALTQLQALTADPSAPPDWVALANKLRGEIQPKAERPQVAEQADIYELLKDKLWDWHYGLDMYGPPKGTIRLLADGTVETTYDSSVVTWNSEGGRRFRLIKNNGEYHIFELSQDGREAMALNLPGVVDAKKRLAPHPTSASTIEAVEIEALRKVVAEQPDTLGEQDILKNLLRGNRHQALRFLIDNGMSTNIIAHGYLDRSILDIAATDGDITSVKMLLDRGADVNQLDNRNLTPLMSAAALGRPEIVEFLLNRGASINHTSSCVGEAWRDPTNTTRDAASALHVACMNGSLPTVRLLLDRGSNINAVSENKHATPLIAAMDCMHLEVVKELLARGANPNLPEDGRVNPLRQMTHEGQVEMVKLLLAKGARYDLQSALPMNSGGLSRTTGAALHTAAREGRLAVAQVLVEAGCPVDLATPVCHETPLHAAALNGNTAMVKWLLEKGADPKRRLAGNISLQSGWTPLHSAAQRGALEVAGLLMAKGVSPADVCDAAGYRRTALHLAVLKGSLPVVKSMLAQPAYQNPAARKQLLAQPDSQGNTALHLAVSRDAKASTEMVKLLLESGAPPDAINTSNLTPAQLAIDPAQGTRDEAVRNALRQ